MDFSSPTSFRSPLEYQEETIYAADNRRQTFSMFNPRRGSIESTSSLDTAEVMAASRMQTGNPSTPANLSQANNQTPRPTSPLTDEPPPTAPPPPAELMKISDALQRADMFDKLKIGCMQVIRTSSASPQLQDRLLDAIRSAEPTARK